MALFIATGNAFALSHLNINCYVIYVSRHKKRKILLRVWTMDDLAFNKNGLTFWSGGSAEAWPIFHTCWTGTERGAFLIKRASEKREPRVSLNRETSDSRRRAADRKKKRFTFRRPAGSGFHATFSRFYVNRTAYKQSNDVKKRTHNKWGEKLWDVLLNTRRTNGEKSEPQQLTRNGSWASKLRNIASPLCDHPFRRPAYQLNSDSASIGSNYS